MTLLKKCGPQIRVCLFMFRHITSKQLKIITTFDTFSCLGGPEVMHQTVVRDILASISGSCWDFYVLFCVCCCCCVLLVCSKKHYLSRHCAVPFCNVNSFRILYMLQKVWLIISVSRCRPTIFKRVRLIMTFGKKGKHFQKTRDTQMTITIVFLDLMLENIK